MNVDTEVVDGTEYPAPGAWSVAWVEGEVVSYRWKDDGDRIHDDHTAHLYSSFGTFGTVDHLRVDVDGDRVAVVEAADHDDVSEMLAAAGDVLAEHPNEDK